MATAIAGLTQTPGTGAGGLAGPASGASGGEVSKEAFLQLLVTQIRHQNPLDPMDGIEFLTQLAQFTSLEQMMSIRQDLASIRDDVRRLIEAETPSGPAEPPAEETAEV